MNTRLKRVAGRPIARIVETWGVVDRWWTEEPERREYAEVELETNEHVTLVRDLGGAWRCVHTDS